MPRIPVLFVAAILAPLAVAGCFPNPEYRDLPDARVIGRHTETLGALAVADLHAPTEAEKAEIASSLAAVGEAGLRVRVQLGRAIVRHSELDLRRRVADLGIPPGIAVLERTAGTAETRLVFERTTLTAPDCSKMVTPNESWTFATSTYAAPRPDMAFGCATYTNLSRQISDPADLGSPRALGPADGTTTAAAVERYHQNAVTPLQKSTSTQGSGISP
jgi:Pilus biogenesis CpaD protein (pilus_cpaD).